MKKLTKIRLINWHYLANETINVKIMFYLQDLMPLVNQPFWMLLPM